jgi:hypothetical protein
MYDVFANANCIGISLKKLGKGEDAHSKIFNAGKPITADFTGVKLGEVMTDSKDIYIQYKSEGKPGEVQLRNFSSRPVTSSWQGEIKGKAAAGGKIGGGVIFEGALSVGVPRTKLKMPPSNTYRTSQPIKILKILQLHLKLYQAQKKK